MAPPASSLHNLLSTPPHLVDAQQTLRDLQDPPKVSPDPEPDVPDPIVADLRMQEQWTFTIHWQDARGKVWTGTFTNKILSISEKITAGLIRAKRQQGVPPEVLAEITYELIHMVSWMELSLVSKPDWAKNLFTLLDEELVQAIYAKVVDHELTFHGRAKPPEDGAGQS